MNLSSCTSKTPPDTCGFSSRTGLLLGEDGVARLAAASVAVFGLGGVGSFVAEALVRAGVGRLLLVDADIVAESNLNRQLVALRSTLGRPKVEVMSERILDINPGVAVESRQEFYSAENADTFDLSAFGYVADAIDSVPSKLELAARAIAVGIPIISCMGAGNKLDPTLFRVADIAKTSVCPLCRTMRRQLRARGIPHLTVVYSPEIPRSQPVQSACAAGRRPVGSVSFVPAAAGLVLAGHIIRALSGVD
ncbi:MAG: tRNA threonylcarbamoyladenosine dehydratase [Kiritimatiellae bacterium]|nr:tRNA threonylcarbamoyladenosine dehydratase [Kiritimatiellia bacterium]